MPPPWRERCFTLGGRGGRFERFVLPSEFPALAKLGHGMFGSSPSGIPEFLVCCFWHGSLRSGTRGPRRSKEAMRGEMRCSHAGIRRSGAWYRSRRANGSPLRGRNAETEYDPLRPTGQVLPVPLPPAEPTPAPCGVFTYPPPPVNGALATSMAVCCWRWAAGLPKRFPVAS